MDAVFTHGGNTTHFSILIELINLDLMFKQQVYLFNDFSVILKS